jgi:hypothetical protein
MTWPPLRGTTAAPKVSVCDEFQPKPKTACSPYPVTRTNVLQSQPTPHLNPDILGGPAVASTIWKYVIEDNVNRKPKNGNVLQRFYSQTRLFIPTAKTIFSKQKQKNGTTPSMHIKRVRSKKCEEMIAQNNKTVQITNMNSIILTIYTAHATSGSAGQCVVQAVLASGTLKSTQMNVRINQLKLLAALQGRGGTRMRQEGNFRQNRTSGHVDTLSLVLYTLQAVAATMFFMHRLGTSLEARDLKKAHSR